LDSNEFYLFLSKINPTISSIDSQELFDRLDQSQDKQIDFNEFCALFEEYDFSDIKDPAENLINELREIIIQNNLNIRQIFNNFDKDHSDSLVLIEFDKLIKKIAPGLKPDEVEAVFKRFDLNKDGSISFAEFEQLITSEDL